MNSQAQNIIKPNNKDTTEFKTKDNKVINQSSLKNGTNTFLASDGTKLVIAVQNKKVSGYTYYSPDGKEYNSKRIEDLIGPRKCSICITIRYPDGSTQKLCSEIPCPTIQGINKGLN